MLKEYNLKMEMCIRVFLVLSLQFIIFVVVNTIVMTEASDQCIDTAFVLC